jgi:membrane protein DedA with SNARE-associated domain
MAECAGRVPTVLDPLLATSAPPAQLPGVLHGLEPTLDRFGYAALGLIFLEDFGVPVPGETVLIIAAVYAGTGRFNIWLVALLGFVAAVAGDNVGFAIGHFGGRALVERFGKYIFITPERLDKTAAFFDRHGGKVIVIARFVEGLRQANGIIAGTTGMHWKRFLPFNMLGAALWVGVWVSIGYFSGSHIDTIYNTATRYEAYLGIAVGLFIVVWIGRRVWRWQRRRAPVAQTSPAGCRAVDTAERTERSPGTSEAERARPGAGGGYLNRDPCPDPVGAPPGTDTRQSGAPPGTDARRNGPTDAERSEAPIAPETPDESVRSSRPQPPDRPSP